MTHEGQKVVEPEQAYSRAEYIRKWGNATSIALLNPACQLFSTPGINGVIGYRLEARCAIAFGDPICPPDQVPRLAKSFHDYCTKNNNPVVYVAASENFAYWTFNNYSYSGIQVGHEFIVDPTYDPRAQTGKNGCALRSKCKHALRHGIVVKEYDTSDNVLEENIVRVGMGWLRARRGPQIRLFDTIDVFADRTNKRWFYAEYGKEIIGVLILNRIDAHCGWVLNMAMIHPRAPNGTSETLVLSVLDILRAEGCRFFSIGAVPAPWVITIEGLGPVSRWLVPKLFSVVGKIFHLGHRQQYWKKFAPQGRPSFLLFSRQRVGLLEILGILRALNVQQ